MTERLKPLRGEAAKLLKLVTEATDTQTLEQALELGTALGQPAPGLLDGIEVKATGELLPSSRFRGTHFTQSVLDLLLVHQLSMALEGTPEAALRRSVRRLELSCRVLPPLRGFDGLASLSITLMPGTRWADVSAWGPMPGLLELTVTQVGTQDQPSGLASLGGLSAPALQVATLCGLGLTSVEGLSATTCLRHIDLSLNPALTSVRALATSATCLATLDLHGVEALADLEGLQGAVALETLNLEDCARLRSLAPLADSLALHTLTLEGCASLQSLEGLATPQLRPSRYHAFSLKGCTALTSLRGLPPLADDTATLYLEDMPALTSLDGIDAARAITSLEIEETGLTRLDALAHLPKLAELDVLNCHGLEDIRALGSLPALREIRVRGCRSLRDLPSSWSEGLFDLQLSGGVFTALGQLPATVQKLEVRHVKGLRSLQGAETATGLRELAMDTHLQDISAISRLPHVYPRCFDDGAGPVTPQWLRATFASLPRLRLDLRFTDLKDLQVLVEFEQLVSLLLSDDAVNAYGLGAWGFLADTEVRKAQRAVCRKHQLPLPAFLKPRRVSNKAVAEGGPSLADLRRGLTSTTFADVVAALETLRTSGVASLYDDIVEGVHPPSLYTGDTSSLGKLFREIRAPYRPWARWALTHVLMDAPDAATRAIAVRDAIGAIVLGVGLSKGHEPSRRFPLSRFQALRSITLVGHECSDLSALRDAPPLKALALHTMGELTSLQGLAAMTHLKSLQALHLEDCEALASLQGLEGAAQLTHLVASGCPALKDFSAMAGLRSLQGFPQRGYRDDTIDFTRFAPLTDVGFLAGLQAAQSIQMKVRGPVDIPVLARLPKLQKVSLEVDTLDHDFSCLSGLRELSIELDSGDRLGRRTMIKDGQRYDWSGEFARLETLELEGGEHDLAKLQAPALVSFEGRCHLPSLRGVGHAATLAFSLRDCLSLDGIEGSPLESLDLTYDITDPACAKLPSVEAVRGLTSLNTLRIGHGLIPAHAKQLVGCEQIKRLQADRYSGTLSFLAGWSQLVEIDLRDSGVLTDLDTLCALPSLARVRLRGSATKREAWPKALQERLDFRTA